MKINLLVALLLILAFGNSSYSVELKQRKWRFDGIFGSVDYASARRGFEIHRNVCSACHSLKQVNFSDLASIGIPPIEIQAIAAEYQIEDGPSDDGLMFERKGLPSDRFPSPFKNKQAAEAANGGAYPPDLSLAVKSYHNGANYIYSLLTGYREAPSDFAMESTLHYNPYVSFSQTAMPPPLHEGIIQYEDGTEPTVEEMAADIVNFFAMDCRT